MDAHRPGRPRATASPHTLDEALRRHRARRPARSSSAPPSPSAAPAAASPTTARSSSDICQARPRALARQPRSSSRSRLLGWKEFEMEVMRDQRGQLRHHLLHRELRPDGRPHRRLASPSPRPRRSPTRNTRCMRDASIAVIREIGVETGGSNIQFAVNPETGRMVVIEMNPRVSPLLRAGLQGHRLPHRQDRRQARRRLHARRAPQRHHPRDPRLASSRPSTTSSPRSRASPSRSSPAPTRPLTTADEVASARRWPSAAPSRRALQKALRSLETGLTGFDEIAIRRRRRPRRPRRHRQGARAADPRPPAPRRPGHAPRPRRRRRSTPSTRIDPWFLRQHPRDRRRGGAPARRPACRASRTRCAALKQLGFSDARLATLDRPHREPRSAPSASASASRAVFKLVDTCAAEFEAADPLHLLHLRGRRRRLHRGEARPPTASKVIILGGGPNRIGQGIEFDYCCCHACFALTEAGYETIMVNCNPETVSTDYDTSDRLYFEPLTLEARPRDPPRRAGERHAARRHRPVRRPDAAEPRQRPARRRRPHPRHHARRHRPRRGPRALPAAPRTRLGLHQPANGIARSPRRGAAPSPGASATPLVVRPTYVLGGRAMEIVRDDAELARYIRDAVQVVRRHARPDRQLPRRRHRGRRRRHLRRQRRPHRRRHGAHRGGRRPLRRQRLLAAALLASTPPSSPSSSARPKRMALALGVVGLMNVQFAIQDGDIYVLEVNPRATRTVPFVAKATDSAIAAIAARVMAGEPLSNFPLRAALPRGHRPRRPPAPRRPDDARRPRHARGSRSRRR